MTVITKIKAGERRGATNKGEPQFFLTYLVYSTPDDAIQIDDETKALTTLAVQEGITFGAVHPSITGLIAKDYAIQNVAEDTYLWEITWTFVPGVDLSAPDPGPDDGNLGGVQEAQLIDLWRVDPEPLAGGVNDWIDTMDGSWLGPNPSKTAPDIAGDPVDSMGQPVSGFVLVGTMNVRVRIPLTGLATARALRGSRNNAVFSGADAGKVLYVGFDYDRISSGVYEVTYKFVEDQFFHVRQAVFRDNDGGPIVDENGNAKLVHYFQPFLPVADFSTLPGLA